MQQGNDGCNLSSVSPLELIRRKGVYLYDHKNIQGKAEHIQKIG